MRSSLIQNVLDARLRQIDHGDGVWLYDTAGNRYLDGSSGAVVASIGHAHPRVVEAIARQASRVTFTHRGAFTSEDTDTLADRLASLTGFAGVWFVNSGSEAVEAAMQFALQYYRETGRPERSWFLSHTHGYHGNTLGALSLSGHGRRTVAGDLAYDFPGLPTPYGPEDDLALDDAARTEKLLEGARLQFQKYATKLAAIVFEPVGGATLGATAPPEGYIAGLRTLCDEFDVLMIADEVMTGLGRTGRTLAVDHWDVRPDLVALGKGMGAGYTPIAGTLVGAKVLDAIEQGSRRVLGGHTYAGNPLTVATALAVLDVVEQEELITRSAHCASLLEDGLLQIQSRHPLVSDARGVGMLQALEFVPILAEGTSVSVIAQEVVRTAMDNGLVLYAVTGGFNQAVLIAPPLTITEAEIEHLLATLDRSLSEVEASLGNSI